MSIRKQHCAEKCVFFIDNTLMHVTTVEVQKLHIMRTSARRSMAIKKQYNNNNNNSKTATLLK